MATGRRDMATKKIVRADNWDGKSRPSNKAYDESWNRIFGKKEIDELDESLKQSKRNRQEREDNEAYLKEIKNKL
jgi:hypothetical protein